jgi:acyl-CoA thioesterase
VTSAEDPQQRAERVVRGMVAADEFTRWMGMDVETIAPNRAVVSMTVRPEMVNGFGVAHGGVVFSLADSALAFVSNTLGTVSLSIENSISYPAPVNVGDRITATAEEESTTQRLAFYTVRVTKQDGTIVAIFRGTVYRTSRPHPE